MRFRNRYNNLLARDLKSNVLKCFVPDEMRRSGVMAYARRTRDYTRSYTTQVEGCEFGDILSKNDNEKMRKIHRSHRNILDQEVTFIKNILKQMKVESSIV